MTDTLANYYEDQIESGLRRDSAQIAVVERLDVLRSEIGRSRGRLGRMFSTDTSPRGVYLWGDVGRGKSMLVDGLMSVMGDILARRTHFHAFMRDIHRALHAAREAGHDEPVHYAADEQIEGLALLALDELEINDIVDAMIVGRVFQRVLDRGCAIVVTSNRPPDDLYRDGLKRDLFVPFVKLIEERTDILHLDADRDYRIHEDATPDLYVVCGPHEESDAKIVEIWKTAPEADEETVTFGASGELRRRGTTIRAGFDALCRSPMASASYLDLAEATDFLILDGVPIMGERDHDMARRFILLIDTIYDAGCGLAIHAEAPPGELYPTGTFDAEFRRTISRLHEMTRPDWNDRSGLR